jgi:hypothetical protein
LTSAKQDVLQSFRRSIVVVFFVLTVAVFVFFFFVVVVIVIVRLEAIFDFFDVFAQLGNLFAQLGDFAAQTVDHFEQLVHHGFEGTGPTWLVLLHSLAECVFHFFAAPEQFARNVDQASSFKMLRGFAEDGDLALQLLKLSRLDVLSMISFHVPLELADAAYDLFSQGANFIETSLVAFALESFGISVEPLEIGLQLGHCPFDHLPLERLVPFRTCLAVGVFLKLFGFAKQPLCLLLSALFLQFPRLGLHPFRSFHELLA